MPSWKRYQVHPSVESADSSAVSAKTKVLSAHVKREIAVKLVKLFDDWCKAVRYRPDSSHSAQKTRDQIASGNPGIKLGFSVPPEEMQVLEGTSENDFKDGLIALYNRKKNWIATWCLENAVDSVTVAGLRLAYPQIKPSLSLVALLAFTLGLQRFREQIIPALPDPKAVKPKQAARWTAKRREYVSRSLRDCAGDKQKKNTAGQMRVLLELASLVQSASSEVLETLKDTIDAKLRECGAKV